jgi:hypothetical protein
MSIARIESVQELQAGRSEIISGLETMQRTGGGGNTGPLGFLLQVMDDSIALCKQADDDHGERDAK